MFAKVGYTIHRNTDSNITSVWRRNNAVSLWGASFVGLSLWNLRPNLYSQCVRSAKLHPTLRLFAFCSNAQHKKAIFLTFGFKLQLLFQSLKPDNALIHKLASKNIFVFAGKDWQKLKAALFIPVKLCYTKLCSH